MTKTKTGTKLTFTHKNVPVEHCDSISDGFQRILLGVDERNVC